MIEITEEVLRDVLLTHTNLGVPGVDILIDQVRLAAEAAENERLENQPRDSRAHPEDTYPGSLYYQAGGGEL